MSQQSLQKFKENIIALGNDPMLIICVSSLQNLNDYLQAFSSEIAKGEKQFPSIKEFIVEKMLVLRNNFDDSEIRTPTEQLFYQEYKKITSVRWKNYWKFSIN